MRRAVVSLLVLHALVVGLAAQQAPPAGGGRGQQTPEQREAAAKQAYDREAALPRPIPARDSVWIEELTYLEVRDAMKAGKTTALVMAGSTEQNGPYMAGGKHQYAIKLVGEAIARKLGNALIAPIIRSKPAIPRTSTSSGARSTSRPKPSRPSSATSRPASRARASRTSCCWVTAAATPPGMRAVAQELSAKWADAPHLSRARVLQLDQQGRRPRLRDEQRHSGEDNAEGIHDEYGLTAVMMAVDPKLVRFDERVAAEARRRSTASASCRRKRRSRWARRSSSSARMSRSRRSRRRWRSNTRRRRYFVNPIRFSRAANRASDRSQSKIGSTRNKIMNGCLSA